MQRTRLDAFLTAQHPHYSRTQIKKLIDEGFVLVDGERKKPGHLLHGGEKIEMIRRAPDIPKAEPEPLPLQILYEDGDLLVINKEAGMVVHPAPGNVRGTLVNAVLHHLGNTSSLQSLRAGIVHRLDKGTSGVMVVGKNDPSHRNLSDQFKNRQVQKVYLALVFGRFPQREGVMTRAIGRDSLHRRKFSSRTRFAREAVTRYQVSRDFGPLTYLEVRPETGRTHQIRVHLSEIHHPIVGDTLYGAKSYLSSIKEESLRRTLEGVSRPLLHAWRLMIQHPRTGEKMTFDAPLPDDFKMVLEVLT